ncbi:MAG TPA: hypothetical protein VIH57_03905 [Bacteroidales bacterium]
MGTLKLNNKLALLSLFILSACGEISCKNTGTRQIILSEWHQPLPQKITIEQFKKGSNFATLEKKYTIDDLNISFYTVHDSHDLVITPRDDSRFSYNAEFILTINNQYEYKIDSIIPGISRNNCLLKKARVNDRCDIQSSSYLFDARCANILN